MADSGDARTRILTSSLKCLQLLRLLAGQSTPMSLSALAELSAQPKGSVHQQLRTLVEGGYATQNANGGYQVSLETITLGSSALQQGGIGPQVAVRVAGLAARSGETASLSVLRGDDIFILYRTTIDSSLMTDLAAGRTMPAHSSASGGVLRAFADDRRTPPDEDLAGIRRQGYAVVSDEFLVGMTTIAVPVRLPGLELAALSLAAPTFRFDQEKLLALLTRSRMF
ncbi:helix-turn-helix domain-containing protein [Leucobacter weissii]|uniref:Helix-turn-helix domain-containing protein n=1 Tax=Leucobacter weissii TaxID=1983706 RepID=A0A939SBV5_9MICO|nr:IclR family transcriptional regulator C-terminal domain-containing protein [Leucobacter weissii]MBO1901738.1 helix-turn-helix domain-containing protein [Leucobacter weissii]